MGATNHIFSEADCRKAVQRRECVAGAPPAASRFSIADSATVADSNRCSQPLWFKQFAERVHRCCKAIERARGRHVSVRKAPGLKRGNFARFPSKPIPGSSRAWLAIRWLRIFIIGGSAGKVPHVVCLALGTGSGPITADQIRRFVGACARPGTLSFCQATKLARCDRSKVWRIRSRLPVRLVLQIRAMFALRRQSRLEARAAAVAFQAPGKTAPGD